MALVHVSRPGALSRRRSRTAWFLKQSGRLDVDGVTIVGAGGEWAVDAAGYRISFHEEERRSDCFWWLHGPGIDPVEAVDPAHAIAILRAHGLLPGRAS